MQKVTVGQPLKKFARSFFGFEKEQLGLFPSEFQRSPKIGLSWLKAFHFSKLQRFIREGLYN